ncbi:MAG TPA: DUF1697 domain-containing protein [Clostridium sp.]
MRYIALLKGINVGGKKNVKTYIQSGNVIFDYDLIDTIKLANKIEKKVSETFGFLIKTIIRTEDELKSIIANNPFVNEPNIELDKLHVIFMIDIPDPDTVSLLDIKKEENEKFIIGSKEIYLYCPNGYGRTKLNNAMFEKKLKTVVTTRNWKTINNIASII